jgi:flavin reductase (DIM6/NTAB) family NADH-FMN oxidoreductase RutF
MKKVTIDTNVSMYPMPVVLVGTMVQDRPNFLAIGWISRVNYRPPMLAVSLSSSHFSNQGIHASRAFSVNVPGLDLIEETDYCGLVSGREVDKGALFHVHPGPVTGSPLIEECPLCLECRLAQVHMLPTNELFIGEIVAAYADERILVDDRPDVRALAPFTLTMPDNIYWKIGEQAGKAWSIGWALKDREKT